MFYGVEVTLSEATSVGPEVCDAHVAELETSFYARLTPDV